MKYHFRHYKFFLLVIDIGILISVFAFSYFFKFHQFPIKKEEWSLIFIFIIIVLVVFYLLDLYNPWSHYSKFPLHYRSIAVIPIIGILYLVFGFLFLSERNPFFESRLIYLYFILLLTPMIFFSRFFFYYFLDPERLKINWLMITDQSDYVKNFQKEIDYRGGKWQIYYLVDKKSQEILEQDSKKWNIIGNIEEDFSQILQQQWTGIILAVKNLKNHQIKSLITIKRKGTPIYDLVYFYEYYFFKIPLYYIDESWFLFTRGFMIMEGSIIVRIKYIMDRLLSLFMLLLLSPILMIISILVWIYDGSPIIFKQERLGQDNKPFTLYKFRTMIKDAEKSGPQWAQSNDKRITKLGSFLRKSRLDELPQLFNVIKGEMSFIGPRPEREYFIKLLEKEIPLYHFRHFIRPGLTGWAQIMYPYGASIEDSIQKLEYELYYIKNYSLLLDFSILIKTIRIVLFGRGR